MIVQRHRVCNDLKSVVKRAVVLAVDVLVRAVADVHHVLSRGIVLAALVDLQFYTEKSASFAVKYWRGFVVVLLDTAVTFNLVAGAAIGIVAVVDVMRRIVVDHPAATLAVGVVVIVAVLTERVFRCAGVLASVYPCTAVKTTSGTFCQAVVTEKLTVKFCQLVDWYATPARAAYAHFCFVFHFLSSLKFAYSDCFKVIVYV